MRKIMHKIFIAERQPTEKGLHKPLIAVGCLSATRKVKYEWAKKNLEKVKEYRIKYERSEKGKKTKKQYAITNEK